MRVAIVNYSLIERGSSGELLTSTQHTACAICSNVSNGHLFYCVIQADNAQSASWVQRILLEIPL